MHCLGRSNSFRDFFARSNDGSHYRQKSKLSFHLIEHDCFVAVCTYRCVCKSEFTAIFHISFLQRVRIHNYHRSSRVFTTSSFHLLQHKNRRCFECAVIVRHILRFHQLNTGKCSFLSQRSCNARSCLRTFGSSSCRNDRISFRGKILSSGSAVFVLCIRHDYTWMSREKALAACNRKRDTFLPYTFFI